VLLRALSARLLRRVQINVALEFVFARFFNLYFLQLACSFLFFSFSDGWHGNVTDDNADCFIVEIKPIFYFRKILRLGVNL
jgi:hypothetical protein